MNRVYELFINDTQFRYWFLSSVVVVVHVRRRQCVFFLSLLSFDIHSLLFPLRASFFPFIHTLTTTIINISSHLWYVHFSILHVALLSSASAAIFFRFLSNYSIDLVVVVVIVVDVFDQYSSWKRNRQLPKIIRMMWQHSIFRYVIFSPHQ